jgi:hypothetical protein
MFHRSCFQVFKRAISKSVAMRRSKQNFLIRRFNSEMQHGGINGMAERLLVR